MLPDLILFESLAIPIKLAISEEEQAKGLMGEMNDVIMAFPYKETLIRKFWMFDTPKPLDIIFCNSNKVIDVVCGSPFSLEKVGPDEPSNLVIEMPFGLGEKIGIKKGSSFKTKYSTLTQLKLIK